jgi:hypothetical protein
LTEGVVSMLNHWNFGDDAANATLAQINRQKSALNLFVVALDRHSRSGIFADPKRREDHTATLKQCDCHDFNFAGRSPRQRFAPCMHIYRLAMELGLLEPKYLDAGARRHAIADMKYCELARLRHIPRDPAE